MIKPNSKHVIPDVFHIGYQRTGTTWVQKGVFPQLEDELFIPLSRVSAYYHATKSHDLIGVYDDISLDEVNGRIVLESEEVFSGGVFHDEIKMPERIAWVNPNAKIIITIRSQLTLIPSLYPLYIRKGGTSSFNDFVDQVIENNKLDYYKLISCYREKFGYENVSVLFFEDLVDSKSEYIKKFLSIFNIKKTIILPDDNLKNISPACVFVKLQRLYNLSFGLKAFERSWSESGTKKHRKKLTKRANILKPIMILLHLIQRNYILKTKFVLSINQIERIQAQYVDSNTKLFTILKKTIINSGYPGDNFNITNSG